MLLTKVTQSATIQYIMSAFADLVERNPSVTQAAYDSIESALNQVLPGSDVHARYRDVGEVGLALIVGRTTEPTFNPIKDPLINLAFEAYNVDAHPDAWGEIAPEFLEGEISNLAKFAFFALAKTENMRLTGKNTSYDSNHLQIIPGRVGFAGGRRLLDTFVTPSGLWEVHDHLVAGAFVRELTSVAVEEHEPRTSDEFAEHFEKEFARIKVLHEGVEAEDIPHSGIGQLLAQVDDLPYEL